MAIVCKVSEKPVVHLRTVNPVERRGMLIMLKDSDTEEIGIRVNSFYDVFPDERTEEELQEYKRLIGMPLTEDYEELINSLK